ncbi:MAG: DUF479 domain-containing protein [Chitinophagaceae bacterium]|nr:DUF479 domain-containing protein [Chitinophagaceae bacterium]
MISDYVKGRKKLLYPEQIQRGIALHRAIDTYTDQHDATKAAKEFFRPDYRLYAGACVDVVYDHFLANDVNEFETEAALNSFAQKTYNSLEPYKTLMPEKFAAMLPYMQSQNWLYHYKFKFGIEKSFGGLVRRSAYLTDSAAAFAVFEKHYDELHQCYDHFFPGVKQMAIEWLHQNDQQNFTSGIISI